MRTPKLLIDAQELCAKEENDFAADFIMYVKLEKDNAHNYRHKGSRRNVYKELDLEHNGTDVILHIMGLFVKEEAEPNENKPQAEIPLPGNNERMEIVFQWL
ncbi:hypothetical protein ACJMK2_023974 [Sinanodonta woodiana]|uniref:Uncharacterized protein n=1 Tax=Sinanodonta woodiana TaxID=1069815 RepID=A0ABD3T6R8_SINWO